MGFFDFFSDAKVRPSQKQTDNMQYAQMLSGNYPIFTQFGNDIYASDVVQQAMYKIVTEMKKLRPRHVRRDGFDYRPVSGDVQRVLDFPNRLMTKSDLLEKITWQVLLNYNAFVYQERNANGKLIGMWPIQPVQVTFLEAPNGKLYCEMLFRNGDSYTLPYDSFIHIRTHYSVNDFMGGDANGQPENDALLKTLRLNDLLLQGVQKALQTSFVINGIVKYNTLLDDGKLAANIADFESKLQNSQSGILPLDMKSEYTPIQRDLEMVDEKTLEFIDQKILRHIGVPLCIMTGDYTTEQYEAFYQSSLEHLVINYSEAFTKGIFTAHESQGFDNKIYFYARDHAFMSTAQVLEMVNILGQSGTLYENEKRVALGLEPLEELTGVRLQSLNYVSVKDAHTYQMGRANLTGEQQSDGTGDNV